MKASRIHTAIATALIAALTLPALAAAKVDSYPESVDLGQYRTYSWTDDADGPSPMEAKIREAIDRQFQARGLQKVEGQADLEARSSTDAWSEVRFDSHPPLTLGPRASRWAWHRGIEVTEIREVERGRFDISLVDNDDTVVWLGSAEGSPRKKMEKNIRKMEKAVDEMFEDFPEPIEAANAE